MTPPLTVFRLLLTALVLGCLAGVFYGFLRPLRPRLTHFADLLFAFFAGYLWLVLNFAVCRGDIRLVYNLTFLGGCFLWDRTAGVLTRPLFSGFWCFIAGIVRVFSFPFFTFLKKN